MEDSKSNTKTLKFNDQNNEEVLSLDVVDNDPERNTDIAVLVSMLGEIAELQEKAASEIHSICCRAGGKLFLQILDKLPTDRKQALIQVFRDKVVPINKDAVYNKMKELVNSEALEAIWAKRNDRSIDWEVELGLVLRQTVDFNKAMKEDLSKSGSSFKEDMIARWKPSGLLDQLKNNNERFMIAALIQTFVNFLVFFGEHPEAVARVNQFILTLPAISGTVGQVTDLNNKERNSNDVSEV